MPRFVAGVLLLAPAAGTVFWTVDDAVQKKIADVQTSQSQASELEAIQKSTRFVDNLLTGNQSILQIIQKQLNDAKKEARGTGIQVQEQKTRVEQATRNSTAAKVKLQKSIAKTQDSFADVQQAKAALNAAEVAFHAKEAEVQTARAAYEKAYAHLNELIDQQRDGEIASAYADMEYKKHALEAAEAELRAAKTNKDTQSETLSEAMKLAHKREVEQQNAQRAFDDASATLEREKAMLKRLKAKHAPYLLNVQRLSRSFDNQNSTVESLKSESERMHQNLQLKQDQHDALRRTIAIDASCIVSLRNLQEQVRYAEAAYNATRLAFTESHTNDLLQAAWGAWDTLDNFRLDFHYMQKRCAPQTVNIPASAKPPPVCDKNTGGSCRILWCYSSRHAYCDQSTSNCLCSSDSCSVLGQSQSRGPPPAATLEEPAVPEQAEAPTSGSLKICVVVLAVLIVMTAAAVQKRSDSRNVILTERLIE